MRTADWPSLRPVIPFMGGILTSNTLESTTQAVPLLYALTFILAAITLAFFFLRERHSEWFGAALTFFWFTAGCLSGLLAIKESNVEWPEERGIYTGTLTEYPSERARSHRLSLELTDTLFDRKHILLYVPKDSLAASLQPGDLIRFHGRINPPATETDIMDFDYALYLKRKGISGTLYAAADSWTPLKRPQALPLKAKSKIWRKQALELYRKWGFQDQVLAVVAAVSLGYKDEIDNTLRQAYSQSGASHVLAVSGLHVGIMWTFLSALFPAFMNRRKLRWTKELLILLIMWSYSFLIGLPVSITRSLIMFSFLSFCRLFQTGSSSINSLGFAALAILLASPMAIYEISFQLSFMAVLSILLLEPALRPLCKSKNRVVSYLWSIITVSLAAQVGTQPLVMHHFSSLSTYSILTNIMVLPLMFLVVCLSVILWIVAAVPFLRVAVVRIMTLLVSMVNSTVEFVTSMPHSSVELGMEKELHVYFLYAVMALVYLYLRECRTRRLVQALTVTAVWSAANLIITLQQLLTFELLFVP